MPTPCGDDDRRREQQTREYADQIAALLNQIEDVDPRFTGAMLGQIAGPVFIIGRTEAGWAVIP
jgi:hypothetical protein